MLISWHKQCHCLTFTHLKIWQFLTRYQIKTLLFLLYLSFSLSLIFAVHFVCTWSPSPLNNLFIIKISHPFNQDETTLFLFFILFTNLFESNSVCFFTPEQSSSDGENNRNIAGYNMLLVDLPPSLASSDAADGSNLNLVTFLTSVCRFSC